MQQASPFDQLIHRPRARLPKTTSASVVVGGKRITDVRQVKVDADHDDLDGLDVRTLRNKVQAAKAAARYQRIRLDPEKMAKRQAWYVANRAKVLAYKKKWDARNVKRMRKLKLDWQLRAYQANPEKFRQRARAYYAKNRERILARLAAKAAAKKAGQGASHG